MPPAAGLDHGLMLGSRSPAEELQRRLASRLARRPLGARFSPARTILRRRHEDGDARALAGLALDLDRAAMPADDTVHHGKAETGSFADLFGGEERLEHPL